MNFKDQMQKDLGTFLNAEEHAGVHVVDGIEMEIIIDEDAAMGRDRQPQELYNTAAGVYVASKSIFARASDFTDRPVVDQRMNIDGKWHMVSNVSESMGMLRIQLEANEA